MICVRKGQYISDDMLERGNRYQMICQKGAIDIRQNHINFILHVPCYIKRQEFLFFTCVKIYETNPIVIFQIDTEGLFIITVLYQMKMIFTVPMSLMNLKKNVLTNSQLQAHVELSIHLWVCINQTPSQGQGVLMKHSTIFQLYHFCQFYWWR